MTYAAIASAQRVRAAAQGRLPALVVGLAVAPVLAANGGYFPTSWGWAGMALAWLAVLGAATTEVVRPSARELAFVGALTAFAGWVLLELLWTTTQSETGLEFQRMLVYVAGALAVVTLVGRDRVPVLLGSLCTGMSLVCIYALATRLFPHGNAGGDFFSGSRLATPVGYWNGLGVVAGMTTLLALTFVARAPRPAGRAAAAAAVPLLLATLYFTFGRGAWLSLLVGIAVLFAADRRRLDLLFSVVPPLLLGAVGVWRASQASALTHTTTASVASATHQGRTLAAVLAALCLVSGYAAYGTRRLEHVWDTPTVARAARRIVAGLAVVVVATVFVRFGSPVTIAHHAYTSFTGSPAGSANLNDRLFSLSNNGRIPAWKVAWHGFVHHPLTGVGPGGFENYWNQHRTVDLKIRDAHNFYAETLAEDGAIGFAILGGALLVPLLAFRRARRESLAAGALAVYVMYLVAVIADWHWELSGVTLAALLCGGALLAAGRNDEPAGRWRFLPLSFGTVVALVALSGLAGHLLLIASADATRSNDWSRAASDARIARVLMPSRPAAHGAARVPKNAL